ncbi:alpha-N-arabinofuranosidase [Eubacteriales bacterium OttesenSCG-928-N13]|nr:alpha-N-arabinofuranosidase [Eubacteriales bacterium OttesenSCG-928-N13]
MNYQIHTDRVLFSRDPMIYGQFLEHFHRQIYGGVYEPDSPLSDEQGFRTDVLDALRQIRVPVIRWPGGCFVSSYHWEKGVGETRVPSFDKAWRVEDPNTFGTDEFIQLCRKIGCQPYICTNAGTGTEEEMSNWMEYCNLVDEGEYARRRIANGHREPYGVKYWSIGNENYGGWEIGAKSAPEWSRYVLESSKMMQHVDPTCSLSAAALDDLDWNIALLKAAGDRLEWISIHAYWDPLWQENKPADYETCMGRTSALGTSIRKVRGLLNAMGLEHRIKIAFDEWNLRGWHHPHAHTIAQGITKDDYLLPRDENDINSTYTMADAVFSACFLNELLRNADIVGMANFAPIVNTRGAIFTHPEGIVKRTTYHVFDLYVNHMHDQVLAQFAYNPDRYSTPGDVQVDTIDLVATRDSDTGALAISAINKHATEPRQIEIALDAPFNQCTMHTLDGDSPDDYNDIGRDSVQIRLNTDGAKLDGNTLHLTLPPHSVNVIECAK